jgi:hypothetical protein
MELGPAEKKIRLDAANARGVWNPRYIRTIELDTQDCKMALLIGMYQYKTDLTVARSNPLAAVKSLLRIHQGGSACGGTLRPAIARLSSDHLDIAGSIEAVTRLRNSLEELLSYRAVYFDVANNYWLVDIARTNPGYHAVNLPLKIGRCPVYLTDSRDFHHLLGLYSDNFEPISPYRICNDSQIWEVAEAFPHSIGMRVHKWGHVEILFESTKKLRQGLSEAKLPGAIGGLTWNTRVLEIEASTSNTCAGVQVAANADEFANALGCVGLRIRQKGEYRDSWTTTTHAWMIQPRLKSPWPRNLMASLATMIRRSRILSATVDTLRGSEAEGKRSLSVLGTDVFVAGTRMKVRMLKSFEDSQKLTEFSCFVQIGTITKCYDSLRLPDSTLLFPLGLEHDLSLITGHDLPEMSMPPNFPMMESSFADPDEALKASDVFLSRFNVRFGRWDTFTGHAVTGSAREALVVGMDYFWQRRHVKPKRALIWRTETDDHSVAGASGSTLCLGAPSAQTCKPVVFQNYQTGFHRNNFWAMDGIRNHISGYPETACFKGGFLLPEDVRTAEIIMADESPRRRSVSGSGAASKVTAEKQKRNLSDNL